MLRAALGDDLGLGDAEAVDPLLDDLAGELEVVLGGGLAVGGAGGQRDGGAAAQVEAELRGAVDPVKKIRPYRTATIRRNAPK